ncbi:gliding motility-associated C-terminal domain-containing protein [Fibrisoma montanum]|uniref:gliding motility-associated C-terminal domain-containing protein n=1 Tax=Fibrisoma montanum TaxID=2305895 RepID=UPI0011C221E9|nr:gliding motility-associated C-terminal domain-containing protein [Fibrisoma montanum]
MKNAFFTLLALGLCQLTAKAQLTISITGPDNSPSTCTRTLTANVSGGSGNYSYTWGTTNSCTPPNNTSNSITITCDNNSVAYVFVTDNVTGDFNRSVNVAVNKIIRGPFNVFVPNVFTPNGDGINDTWGPAGADPNQRNAPLNAYFAHIEGVWSQQRMVQAFNSDFYANPGQTDGILGNQATWNGGSYASGSYFYTYVRLQNCTNSQEYFTNVTLLR